MLTKIGAASAVALAAAVLLAACGGGGGGGNGTTTSATMTMHLTKAKLVQRADAICTRHFEKISAGANKLLAGGKLPSPKKFADFARGTLIPQYSAQIAELRSLHPPSSLAPAYRKWLADSQQIRMKMMMNPRLITNGANFAAVNREAGRLGLSAHCRVGPG